MPWEEAERTEKRVCVSLGRLWPTLAKPCVAKTKFGNQLLPEPSLPSLAKTKFGQKNIGQSIFGTGVCHGGTPKGGGPKISRFFPLSRTPIFALFCLSLSGCLLVDFWCLKRRDPQMCTFGVPGLMCETPAAPKPPEERMKIVAGE